MVHLFLFVVLHIDQMINGVEKYTIFNWVYIIILYILHSTKLLNVTESTNRWNNMIR